MDMNQLIEDGPNPRYQMQRLARQHFAAISKARQLRRTWAEIAQALGLGKNRWPSLARAYRKLAAESPPMIASKQNGESEKTLRPSKHIQIDL